MRRAIYLVIITAVISGLANFFNKLAMSVIGKDAFQYTTLKNIVVALALSLVVLTPLIWSQLRRLEKKDWLKLGLIGLIGGSIPFLLFFKGLSLTSSVSASFIHKTLFIWVAVLAWPILKERITKIQFLALGLLLLGNIIFESFKGLSWGIAETLILLATLFWAIETVIAKMTLKSINPLILAWGRMFFGSWLLIGFLLITKNTAGLFNFNPTQIGWLLLVSALLTGYVVTWYSALKKLPANIVTCFLVIASPITTFLNAIFVNHKVMNQNILGAVIILLGIFLFLQFSSKARIKIYEIKAKEI